MIYTVIIERKEDFNIDVEAETMEDAMEEALRLICLNETDFGAEWSTSQSDTVKDCWEN